MIPSKNAEDRIKRYEGCKLNAYQDIRGIWTVGWGTTGPGIQEGLTISQNTANAMLTGHIRELGLSLTDLMGNSLNQNQFDACICLIYNIGMGAFRSSSLLRLIKARDYPKVALEWLKWDHSGGKEVEGLKKRREDERDLFTAA